MAEHIEPVRLVIDAAEIVADMRRARGVALRLFGDSSTEGDE